MIFDAQALFSNQQAITATANSENVIDLCALGIPYGNVEALKRFIGKGTKIPLLVQCTEDFATLTSLTITFVSSAAENLGTPTTHATTGAVLAATLKKGWIWGIDAWPVEIKTAPMLRYAGLIYTVGGSNATTGKIMAGVTMGNQTNDTI